MAQETKLAAGQRFGQWTLTGDEELGRGGNGVVWKTLSDSGKVCAIKLLHRHNFTTRKFDRFRDEIAFMQREAGRAGLLPLIDSNLPEEPTPENRPWLVTPLGTPFNKLNLAGASRLSELVQRMEAIARALAALHAEHKWHRDLKPDNLLDVEGAALVGDFGLVDFPDKGAITQPTEIMGPMFYVAPEMMIDAADVPGGPADVYSFAKTLWVLSSGQKFPLPGEQRG